MLTGNNGLDELQKQAEAANKGLVSFVSNNPLPASFDSNVDARAMAQAEQKATSKGAAREDWEERAAKLKHSRGEFDNFYVRAIFWTRIFYSAILLLLCWQWLRFVCQFVYDCGLGNLKVDTSVQIALITTTTANVIAVYIIGANWLFPKHAPKESEHPQEQN